MGSRANEYIDRMLLETGQPAWDMTRKEYSDAFNAAAKDMPRTSEMSTYAVEDTIKNLRVRLADVQRRFFDAPMGMSSATDRIRLERTKIEGQLKDAQGVLADRKANASVALKEYNCKLIEWYEGHKNLAELVDETDYPGRKGIRSLSHDEIVRAAHSRGLPIRKEVLVDYPGLVA